MKKRIAYISLYFFTVLLIFILQKPLFMLYNGSIEKGFGFADYMQVMVHGASTKERKRFTADNLSAENQSGMVIYDAKFADVKPIESKPFTVNAAQMAQIKS